MPRLSILFQRTSKYYHNKRDTQSFPWSIELISTLGDLNSSLSTDVICPYRSWEEGAEAERPTWRAPVQYRSRPVPCKGVVCCLFSCQSPRKRAYLKWQHSDRCNPFPNTDTSANVHKCNTIKQRGRQQPELKNSAFCQQHPQARTHSKAVSNLISKRQHSGIKMHGGLQEPDTPSVLRDGLSGPGTYMPKKKPRAMPGPLGCSPDPKC